MKTLNVILNATNIRRDIADMLISHLCYAECSPLSPLSAKLYYVPMSAMVTLGVTIVLLKEIS